MEKAKLSKAKRAARARRIVNTIVNVLLLPVVAVIIFMSVSVLVAYVNKTVPSFFGYSLISISSKSMENSGFNVGEIVIIQKAKPEAIEKGDYICYYKYATKSVVSARTLDEAVTTHTTNKGAGFSFASLFGVPTTTEKKAAANQSVLIFHEVVDVRVDENGHRWFQTKGTSNYSEDSYYISQDVVVGVHHNNAGVILNAMSWLYQNNLYALVILIPVLIVCVVLTINIMCGLYVALLENDVINRKIKIDDPVCVKWGVGFQMAEKEKYRVIAMTDPAARVDLIPFLWKKAEKPIMIQKYTLYQRIMYNKYKQLDDLNDECSKRIAAGADKFDTIVYYHDKEAQIKKEINEMHQRLKKLRKKAYQDARKEKAADAGKEKPVESSKTVKTKPAKNNKSGNTTNPAEEANTAENQPIDESKVTESEAVDVSQNTD